MLHFKKTQCYTIQDLLSWEWINGRFWIPITASISPEIKKVPKLAPSHLVSWISISTTYYLKLIVHFKDNIGLDNLTSKKT